MNGGSPHGVQVATAAGINPSGHDRPPDLQERPRGGHQHVRHRARAGPGRGPGRSASTTAVSGSVPPSACATAGRPCADSRPRSRPARTKRTPSATSACAVSVHRVGRHGTVQHYPARHDINLLAPARPPEGHGGRESPASSPASGRRSCPRSRASRRSRCQQKLSPDCWPPRHPVDGAVSPPSAGPHHRREQPRTLTCPGKSPFTRIQWQAGDSAPPSCPSTHRYSTSENSAESSHGLLVQSPRRAKPPHRRSSRLFELGPSVNSAHQAVAVA